MEQDVETVEYDNDTTSSEDENSDNDEDVKETKPKLDEECNKLTNGSNFEENNSEVTAFVAIEKNNDGIHGMQTSISDDLPPEMIEFEDIQHQDVEHGNQNIRDSNVTDEETANEKVEEVIGEVLSEAEEENEKNTDNKCKAAAESKFYEEYYDNDVEESDKALSNLDSNGNLNCDENLDNNGSDVLCEMMIDKNNKMMNNLIQNDDSLQKNKTASESDFVSGPKIIDDAFMERSNDENTQELNNHDFELPTSNEIPYEHESALEQKWTLLDDEIMGENILDFCNDITENNCTNNTFENKGPNFFIPRIMIEEIMESTEMTQQIFLQSKECLTDKNYSINSVEFGFNNEPVDNEKLNEGQDVYRTQFNTVEKESKVDENVENREEPSVNVVQVPKMKIVVECVETKAHEMELDNKNDTSVGESTSKLTEDDRGEALEEKTAVIEENTAVNKRDNMQLEDFLFNPNNDDEDVHILRNERKQNNFVERNVLELRRYIEEMEQSHIQIKNKCNLNIDELKDTLQSNLNDAIVKVKNLKNLAISECSIIPNRTLDILSEESTSKSFIISKGYDELIKAHTEDSEDDESEDGDEGKEKEKYSKGDYFENNMNDEIDLENDEPLEPVSIGATLELQIADTDKN